MKELLIVGAGGFAGSVLRYGVYKLTVNIFEDKLFIATATVNLAGCLLIGLLAGSVLKTNHSLYLLLAAGLCGGFTTFSSFGLDGIRLLKDGLMWHFMAYIVVNVVGGLLLCAGGMYLASKS